MNFACLLRIIKKISFQFSQMLKKRFKDRIRQTIENIPLDLGRMVMNLYRSLIGRKKAYNIVEMTHSVLLLSVVDYIIETVADTQLYINQSQKMHIKRSKLNICIIRIDPNLAC